MSEVLTSVANHIWNPILFLLIFGGLYFLFYSSFIQYKYFAHTLSIMRGKFDNTDAPGQINSLQALSTAIASTVGMGNIAGVAIAIKMGGPGAVFWMWITAFVGMSSNFFTSTLAVMYRGKDSEGEIQGGPMYVIEQALPRAWRPLGIMFSVFALIGCMPAFQANQLTQGIIEIGLSDFMLQDIAVTCFGFSFSLVKAGIGCVLMIITAFVIFGGIQRIGAWSAKMVPAMVGVYFVAVCWILGTHFHQLPDYIALIFSNAFTGENYFGAPAFGGVLGGLIIVGVRRAAFSNEAGLGTAPMAMGAAKSTEPIREGLLSMLTPAIDTLLVCTLTALAILVTDVWRQSADSGVTLTSVAFQQSIPGGKYLLLFCAFSFSLTTLFSYNYYGYKSLSYLVGVKRGKYYNYFYLATILISAVVPLSDLVNIIDISYALMAVPTMTSGCVLAPRVMKEAKSYFARMKNLGHI